MSDPRDRGPDPAALDELSRAFGEDRPDEVDERGGGGEPAAEPVADEPVALEPPADELVIVEQVPDEPAASAEPAAPTIIRIDDYSGTVDVRPVDEPQVDEPQVDVRPVDEPQVDEPQVDEPPVDEPQVDEAPSGEPRSDERATGAPEPVVASGEAAGQSHDDVVVIDVEDDLPDPVYVEGSLDRDRGRTIVFIEDDDTGDVMAPDADAQRGIEPRMRERRVAVKRAQSRKRLKWVALGAATVLLAVGALALLGSPLFAVRADQVTITGNVYTDPQRLEEIVDDLVGTPALRVDAERLERELEEISWVDTARVTVDFPHAATIEIRERAAMTTYQGPDGRFRVLDRDGRVLDVIENYPFAYVLLRGPDPVDLEQGEFAPAGYAAASELAKNFTSSIRGRVEYVDVTADGSRLVLFLDDGSTVFFGEARDFFAKLLRLESVLAANPEREPGPIDVSTDDVTL